MESDRSIAVYAKEDVMRVVDISWKCDFACIFCEKRNLKMQSKQEILDTFKEIYNTGVRNVSIGGTEPLNHPDILEILSKARNTFEKVSLQTASLKLADKKFFKMVVQYIDELWFPIYGYTEEVHDYIVGKKGAHKKTLRILKHIGESRIDCEVHTLIMKHNLGEVTDMFRFIHDTYPNFNIRIGEIWPVYPSRKYHKDLLPLYSDITKELGKVMKFIAKNAKGKPTSYGDKFYFSNLPTCVIKKAFPKGQEVNVRIDYHRDYHVVPGNIAQCKKCTLKKQCCGVSREYSFLHGAEGLGM